MKVDADNYEQLRAWFVRVVPEILPADLVTPQSDPVNCLDQLAAHSATKARAGLAMALGDIIEATSGWPAAQVAEIDGRLEREGLPTLTQMRVRFSTALQRVIKRGSIRGHAEYYAVRNAAELTKDHESPLWKLISAYEARVTRD